MSTVPGKIKIAENEIQYDAIRASGAGGQNVNKVSSAIHLRFDIHASSLPDICKERLLGLNDQRISKEGVIVIKAQSFRTREKNKQDALARLKKLIAKVMVTPGKRRPTKPSRRARTTRMDKKTRHGQLKKLRQKVKI